MISSVQIPHSFLCCEIGQGKTAGVYFTIGGRVVDPQQLRCHLVLNDLVQTPDDGAQPTQSNGYTYQPPGLIGTGLDNIAQGYCSPNRSPVLHIPENSNQTQTVDDAKQTRLASDYFGTTPFGIYCHICREPIASKERSLLRHVTEKHNETRPSDLRSFLSRSTVDQARMFHERLLFRYIVDCVYGYVCGSCGKTYVNAGSLRSHCHRKKYCDVDEVRREDVYLTVCGRVVAKHDLERPLILHDHKTNHATTGTTKTASEWQLKHVPVGASVPAQSTEALQSDGTYMNSRYV